MKQDRTIVTQAIDSLSNHGLSKNQIIAWVLDNLALPSVVVAFGGKPVGQQPCLSPRHPNNGGNTRTALCLFRHSDKGKWLFKCHNAECRLGAGDVIDYYCKMAALVFHKHRSPAETAKFLFDAIHEEVFDLAINELAAGTYAHGKPSALVDDPIRWMRSHLCSMQPDEKLIGTVRTVLTLKSFGSFSVRSLCEVLLSGYPDDAWMMTSITKAGYRAQKKVDWLRDKRLCKQSYVYPICFREPRALRVNCLDRLWAIIEFDSISKEYQASFLFYLAERFPEMPLELIVDSGNKSLHAWFAVAGLSQEEYFELFKLV